MTDKISIPVDADVKAALDAIKQFSKQASDRLNKVSSTTDKLKTGFVALGAAFGGITAFKSGINAIAAFETALVGVAKTTNLSGKELEKYGTTLRDLSNVIPVSANDLADISTIAGQLGVKGAANLELFTDTIARLGVATDLNAEDASKSLARILTVTGDGIGAVGNFGSVIVALGNNFAASESEITAVTNEVARATSVFKIGATNAAAISTAMKQLGVRAELAGTVTGKSFRAIQSAINNGGKELKNLKELTGLSGDELKKQFQTNATGVFAKFVKGVKLLTKEGRSSASILEGVGLAGEGVLKTIPALAESYGTLDDAIRIANEEAKTGKALYNESEKAFGTLSSQIDKTTNVITNRFLATLEGSSPIIKAFLEATQDLFRVDTEEQGLTKQIDELKVKLEGLELTGFKTSNSFLGVSYGDKAEIKAVTAELATLEAQLKALKTVEPVKKLVSKGATKGADDATTAIENMGVALDNVSQKSSLFSFDFKPEELKKALDGLVKEASTQATFGEGASLFPDLDKDLATTILIKDAMEEAKNEDGSEGLFGDFSVSSFKDVMVLADDAGQKLGSAVSSIADATTLFIGGAATGLSTVKDILSGGPINQITDAVSDLANIPIKFVESFEGLENLLLGEKNEDGSAKTKGIVNGVVQATEKIQEELPKLIDTIFTKTLPFLIERLGESAKAITTAIVKAAPVILKALAEGIKEIVKVLAEIIPELIDGLLKALPEIIKVLGEAVEILIRALPAIFKSLADNVAPIIVALMKALPGIITALAEVVGPITEALVSAIPEVIEALADNIEPVISALTEAMVTSGPDIGIAIIEGMLLEGGLERIAGAVIRGVIRGLNGFFDGLSKGLDKVFSKFDWPEIPKIKIPKIKIPNLSIPTPAWLQTFIDALKPADVSKGGKSTGKKLKRKFDDLTGRRNKAAGGVIPQGFPSDSFPANLTSGERVLTENQSADINAMQSQISMLVQLLSQPQIVKTQANINGEAFADIILELSRNNSRLTA